MKAVRYRGWMRLSDNASDSSLASKIPLHAASAVDSIHASTVSAIDLVAQHLAANLQMTVWGDPIMKRLVVSVFALMALSLGVQAIAETVTYTVSGAFADGGTFSGSFGYDPIADTYDVPDDNSYASGTGGFNVTTTTGSNVSGRHYQPGTTVNAGYSDVNSSNPTRLYIDGCCFEGTTNLILDWNTQLNAANGGSPQPITGGSETFQPFSSFPLETRRVTGGVVELSASPVPLPAPVCLLLSGLIGLAASTRSRSVIRWIA